MIKQILRIKNWIKYKVIYKAFYKKRLIELEKIQKDCNTCRKAHTMECPNSSLCHVLDNKPYYEWSDR